MTNYVKDYINYNCGDCAHYFGPEGYGNNYSPGKHSCTLYGNITTSTVNECKDDESFSFVCNQWRSDY